MVPTTILLMRAFALAVVVAVVTFCVVQDQAMSRSVGAYVDEARVAASAGRTAPPVARRMTVAIRASVRQGVAWSTVVLAAGLTLAAAVGRVYGD